MRNIWMESVHNFNNQALSDQVILMTRVEHYVVRGQQRLAVVGF